MAIVASGGATSASQSSLDTEIDDHSQCQFFRNPSSQTSTVSSLPLSSSSESSEASLSMRVSMGPSLETSSVKNVALPTLARTHSSGRRPEPSSSLSKRSRSYSQSPDEEGSPIKRAFRQAPMTAYQVGRYLSAEDLDNFIESTEKNSQSEAVWQELECYLGYHSSCIGEKNVIGFRMNPDQDHLQNFNRFISELKERIKLYPDEQLPIDINELLNCERSLKKAEILKLREFIKARDTLVVWLKAATDSHLDSGIAFPYENSDEMIQKAGDFSGWIEENQEAISSELHTLELSNLNLSVVPRESALFNNLLRIFLSHNHISVFALPKGSLPNLQFLYLDHNHLTEFTPHSKSYNKLIDLNLSHNQLRSIVIQQSSLKNIIHLRLSHNLLISFRVFQESLSRLQSLWVDHNHLASLEVPKDTWRRLRYLHLQHNRITQLNLLPEALPNLRELWLENNQIEELSFPEDSFQQLQYLCLSHNRLRGIELQRLSSLIKLWLDHNELESIEASKGSLESLQSLYAEHNRLNAFDALTESLQNLRELHLCHNQFSSWVNKKWPYLQRLYLKDNQLTGFGIAPKDMSNLQELDLSGNFLSSIPAEIGMLPKIEKLTLSRNQIAELPFLLNREKMTIDLNENPINLH